MMRVQTYLILVCPFLALSTTAFAQSNPPSPTPAIVRQNQKSHSEKSNKQTEPNKQKTTQNLPVIKGPESQKTSESTQQKRTECDEKAANERRLVIWAIVLAIATIALVLVAGGQLFMFWRQLRLMGRGAEDTKNLAQASKAQAEALKISERAWIAWRRIISRPLKDVIVNGEEWGDGIAFIIEWVNSGKTPAIKLDLISQTKIVYKEDSVPTFTFTPDAGQHQSTLSPSVIVTSRPRLIKKQDINALRNRQCRIFIYGRADYETVILEEPPKYSEVCFEVEHQGITETGQDSFAFSAAGPQNSAT